MVQLGTGDFFRTLKRFNWHVDLVGFWNDYDDRDGHHDGHHDGHRDGHRDGHHD